MLTKARLNDEIKACEETIKKLKQIIEDSKAGIELNEMIRDTFKVKAIPSMVK